MTQTISAKDVAELRGRTSAGMMDCKKALEEAGGDLTRAAEILRAKGITKAEKRAGRSTLQGMAAGYVNGDATEGALLMLTCETDFVARTAGFQQTAAALLAQLAAAAPTDLAGFLAQAAAGLPGKTVDEVVKGLSGTTGEGIGLPAAVKFAPGDKGTIGLYLHHNKLIGVLVELACWSEGVARGSGAQDLAREIALHIASADPMAVRPEDIPAEVVDRERRIAAEQVAAEGKPEAVRPKIIEGKIRKFLAERALLDQPWVKDDKKTIGQLVTEAGNAAGASFTVTRFVRLRVGEA